VALRSSAFVSAVVVTLASQQLPVRAGRDACPRMGYSTSLDAYSMRNARADTAVRPYAEFVNRGHRFSDHGPSPVGAGTAAIPYEWSVVRRSLRQTTEVINAKCIVIMPGDKPTATRVISKWLRCNQIARFNATAKNHVAIRQRGVR
jgi:hypothetical protein